MAILRAEHLQKTYKKRQILKDVNLAVHSAEVVGLLGPNGAGKTTCFYMIVGLVGVDGGKIFINDLDITQA
ncbi:MAG: export transporter ATP-binding protein, partial [Pseudomonadota bacterium]